MSEQSRRNLAEDVEIARLILLSRGFRQDPPERPRTIDEEVDALIDHKQRFERNAGKAALSPEITAPSPPIEPES